MERETTKAPGRFAPCCWEWPSIAAASFAKARITLESVDLEWPPVSLATNYFEVLCMVREGGNANLKKARALFAESEKAMPSVPSDDDVANHAPDRLLMWLAYKEAKAALDA